MNSKDGTKKILDTKDELLTTILIVVSVIAQIINAIVDENIEGVKEYIFNVCTILLNLIVLLWHTTHKSKTKQLKTQLEALESKNRIMQDMNDELRTFKHDYGNIMQAMSGYLYSKDYDGLNEYYKKLSIECKQINNLGILSTNLIKEPAIYSILVDKYYKAKAEEINVNIEISSIVENEFNQNMLDYARILGILLDNAIESAKECEEKELNIRYYKEASTHRLVCEIENTYKNKNIDIHKIYEKGYSNKNSTGLGLYMVQKLILKNLLFGIRTSHDERYFIQRFLLDEPT